MRKAASVFLRDVRRILHNPVALLVVLGIAAVPCLYAWINVLANWDPYENTGSIPVAVVNLDEPVELEDMGEICTGDMMVDALKDNDSINWQFVDDKDEAIAHVRAGDYYAAIVIPPDFTTHLTGILDGKTDKAHLQYYVNEKVNPIAPKVTDTVASTVQNEVDTQFSAKVGEVVAEKLGELSSTILDKSQGAVDEGLSVLEDVDVTLVEVDNQLGGLSTSLKNAQSALATAADNAASLQGIGSRVSGKLGSALDSFSSVRSNANQLLTDLNAALGSGARTISSVSSRATYDISSIAGDIAAAQAEVDAAIRALEKDLTDNEALVSKLTDTYNLLVSIEPTDESAASMKLEIQNEMSAELDVLVQLTSEQQAKLEELRAIAEKLESAAEKVSNLSESVNGKVQSVTEVLLDSQSSVVSSVLLDINAALDSFVETATELEAVAVQVDPVIAQIVALTRQFSEAIGGTDEALGGTRSSLASLKDQVDQLSGELDAIRTSEMWSYLRNMAQTDPDSVHEFLSAPVDINEVDLFPVENYASGVAPFFTSLALWVGGIALVAIFKLEVDEDEVGKLRPWQAYFGRWMLFVVIGALQAIVCCTGDLIIGIQCAHPWAFYLSAIVASFAFVNIIYGLSVAFKHLGKALAFTLVILQVPGSAGMYPIEMMPGFFQAINPWLPFTYSINAMREAIAGFYGWNLAHNLGMLLLFVVPSILLGVTMRKLLVNINALFDKRLRETDHLMVSEPIAIEGDHYRLQTVVKAIQSPDEYREAFEERSAAFERAYPTLLRRGVLALMLLPLALFCVMMLVGAKLPVIACLVLSLVGIYTFLILVEYFHDRIEHKRRLTELSKEELNEVMIATLEDEFMPYAPVDAIIEKRAARAERAAEAKEAREAKVEGVIDMIRYPSRFKGGPRHGQRNDAPKGGGDE